MSSRYISGRVKYTSERIRNMRSERKNRKSKVEGVSDEQYVSILGDLIGAGHLQLLGFNEIVSEVTDDTTNQSIGMSQIDQRIVRKVSFTSYKLKDRDGESPHFKGYLVSGHPKDPKFLINGWLNDDGTIRLELVKKFEK